MTLHKTLKWILGFWVLLTALASAGKPVWFTQTQKEGTVLQVQVFSSSVCPHCKGLTLFLTQLSLTNPWLKVKTYEINQDKNALKHFYYTLKRFHSSDFSVPTVVFCDSRWVGFDDVLTTGVSLVRAMKYCYRQIEQSQHLSLTTIETLRQWSGVSAMDVRVGSDFAEHLLRNLILTAVLEMLTPCSLFCFLLFLSCLWLYRKRHQRCCIGLILIATLGSMHTFQFLWLVLYHEMLPLLPWISWLGGGLLLLLSILFLKNKSISMWWTVPSMVFALILVYAYQQTCSLSVGAVFQQWLATQTLTKAAYVFFEGTYLLFYLLIPFIITLFYTVFDVHPRKILPVAAAFIIAAVGALLIFYPAWLANTGSSMLVLSVSCTSAWRLVKRQQSYSSSQ